MLARSHHGELPILVDRPTDRRDRKRLAAGQIVARQRLPVLQQILVTTGVHHLAAVLARSRTDVDDPIRCADRVLVVFDDDQRVAQIAQAREGVDQSTVVALVQSDRRFVEDVEHTGKPRTDLSGQANSLCLATRQRPCGTGQRQVVESDVEEERDACLHLFEDAARDRLLAFVELQSAEVTRGVGHRERRHLGDRFRSVFGMIERHREDLRTQPRTLTDRARNVAHVALVPLLHLFGFGLIHAAVEERHDALELGVVRPCPSVPVAEFDVHLVFAAVEQRVPRLGRQLLPRGVDVESHLVGQTGHESQEVVGVMSGRPGCDGALGE